MDVTLDWVRLSGWQRKERRKRLGLEKRVENSRRFGNETSRTHTDLISVKKFLKLKMRFRDKKT